MSGDFGFIKLHRGWRNCEIFSGEFSRADAWVWLIENAAWKETRTRIKGRTLILERGEMAFSVRFLAEKWGWSKSRVDRFLADLKAENMIETRSRERDISGTETGTSAGQTAGQGRNIIRLCNYDKYQSAEDEARDTDGSESGTVVSQKRDKEEELRRKEINNITRLAVHRPAEVGEQVWSDFMALRKSKRAPLTETALAAIRRESTKAGWTLEAALTECVARGWQGFKASWIEGEQPAGHRGVGV